MSTMLPVDPSLDEARLLALIEGSTARLSAAVARLEGPELDAPSLLPGWSRRTIVAHLTFVATAYQRMTTDVLAARRTTTYPGGSAESTGYPIGSWPAGFVGACRPLRIAWLGPHHRSRPEADLEVRGRWLPRAADLERAWVVEASGRTARCRATAPDERADAVLTGAAANLLAFLLGRAPSRPLELAGDEDLARAFKRAFPGP